MDSSSRESSPRNKRSSNAFMVSSAQFDDISRLVDIEFYAFENEKTNHVLSYRDHNQPAHLERAIRSYQALMSKSDIYRWRNKARRFERAEKADATVTRFRKVTDEDAEVIISWAKTETKTYTPEELASPADCGHESDPTMNRDWFALNEKLRRDYMGTQRHCYVGMLATSPYYQHHGAGTMLLEQILAEADEAGIECYLEATDTAKPLYERHGFKTVNEIRFDPAAYGVHGFSIERQTIMIRGALGADGQRKEVRSWDEAVSEETV